MTDYQATGNREKPVADYSPNTCGHPKAYYCRERGCMAILELGCKRGEGNLLCGGYQRIL